MKKIIFLLISIQCSLLISYSQNEWVVQPSGTNNQLNSVYFTGWGFTVGNNGTILYSYNGGTNWITQASGTTNDLYGCYSNFTRSWVVGASGTILMSTNRGVNWLPINSGVNVTLRSVAILGVRSYIVGDNGTILKSTNSGNNWSLVQSPTTADLKCIVSYASLFITGKNGTILKSTNYGTNWSIIPSGTNYDLNKIMFSYYAGWISGSNGTILKSTDLGDSWVLVNSGTSTDLLSISVPDSLNGWVCGLNGNILRTANGGANWSDDHSGYPNNMNDIYFSSANYGWAVGNNGLILNKLYAGVRRNAQKLDANTISSWYTNWGDFNREPTTSNAGFEWPKGSGLTARYASGPWVSAKVGNDTLIAMAEFSYEFLPGYTDNFGNPQGRNDTLYKVYKLNYGVNNFYRQQWPNALLGNSDQGAPVYFDFLTYSWKPLDYADQTMFYSYTDSYPESHTNRAGSTSPLKADIKQINFAFDEPGALGNIQYCQFMIINRNSVSWNDTYITLWTDDDLGYTGDDKEGCDTLLDMGYTYNGQPIDPIYGNNPPAAAFVLIKGPAVYTGNNNDTAFICYGRTKKIKIGYKHQHMSVFNWYANADPIVGDPRAYYETYRYMEGLHRDGTTIINPVTGLPTNFVFSGDPVTGNGWIQSTSGNYRFLMSTGPLTMNPGDTQIIVIAQVIAQGTSNLNSITVLRQYAQVAKDNYYNCFENVPIGIENLSNGNPTRFSLEQNYPNPFNPTTKIHFSIPLNKGGLRGLSVKLTIYDILGREVSTLINQEMKPGRYEVEWDGSNFASGVYFYKLEAGSFVETKKMVLIK